MKRVASGILPVVAINRTSPLPLHRQIYDGFRSAILEGRLRPGQRIPSTRVLAAEIHVSRFPVLNAYAQLLAEGYLESRVGAGTIVSSSLSAQLTSSRPGGTQAIPAQRRPRPLATRSSVLPRKENLPWIVHLGAFRVGQVAFDQFPHQVWSSLVGRRSRAMNAHSAHYGDSMGNGRLRRAISNYLKIARSVRCEPEQVLVVNGSQQALEITTRALLDPGARVWIEEPCYRLAQDVFRLNRCQLVPVPVDEEGLNVAAGIAKCRKARAAFVSPSHQFPLGVTMSASRRLRLIEWAQSSGAWIIEDDYDSEYRYQSQPIASLQGLDPNSRVIYIGTFSKVLFPALRLGYIVVPPDMVDGFRETRRVMDLGSPTFHQEVLADFVEEGHFERHIRRMRTFYGELRRLLVDNLREHLEKTLSPIGDEAGMHLTAMLDTRHRDEEVAAQAVRLGLSLWPLSRLYLNRPRQGFVLGFGGITTKEIPLAVRALCTLLDSKGVRLR
jgi:GntR family transcriptional regulator/MocR family aminotransferase